MLNKIRKYFLKENKSEQVNNYEKIPNKPSYFQQHVYLQTYYEYIANMKADGLVCRDVTLTEKKSGLVTVFPLKKEEYGTFLEIRCPAGNIITIPSIKQTIKNEEIAQFKKYPNLYQYPYSFNIRCTNDENEDMHWSRMVEIERVKTSSEYDNVTSEFYDDLHIKSDSRYKRLEERYYFKEKGILLRSLEILRLKTIPDIDINKVELFMKIDLWENTT